MEKSFSRRQNSFHYFPSLVVVWGQPSLGSKHESPVNDLPPLTRSCGPHGRVNTCPPDPMAYKLSSFDLHSVLSRGRRCMGSSGHVLPGAPFGPPSPRPGPPRVPPSRADPGPPAGRTPKVKNVFRFKLDAKSIPEALATTILILQKFSIDLAHRQNLAHRPTPRPQTRLIRTSSAPLGTPGYPPVSMGPRGEGVRGEGGGTPPNSATQTIIQLLFQFFPGVRNWGWGEGGPSNSANRRFFQ